MAYNFKSIADVEVVAEPLETANVLIEENGVIKKAPKTAVGGAGNLVLAFNPMQYENDDVGYQQLFKSEGIYEACEAMWNEFADLNITIYRKSSDRYYVENIHSIMYDSYEDTYFLEFGDQGYYARCFPDGRVYSNQYD